MIVLFVYSLFFVVCTCVYVCVSVFRTDIGHHQPCRCPAACIGGKVDGGSHIPSLHMIDPAFCVGSYPPNDGRMVWSDDTRDPSDSGSGGGASEEGDGSAPSLRTHAENLNFQPPATMELTFLGTGSAQPTRTRSVCLALA